LLGESVPNWLPGAGVAVGFIPVGTVGTCGREIGGGTETVGAAGKIGVVSIVGTIGGCEGTDGFNDDGVGNTVGTLTT
jgi:hypothetical protein